MAKIHTSHVASRKPHSAGRAGKCCPRGADGNSSSGVVDGGQLGYNYQFGGLVLGAEWTFDGTSLNAPRTVGALQGAGNTKWITTIAGRSGVAADNVLYYGKAGGGWANK
jgi:outer membrane immunogenic protein